jgi:hypothetical protein
MSFVTTFVDETSIKTTMGTVFSKRVVRRDPERVDTVEETKKLREEESEEDIQTRIMLEQIANEIYDRDLIRRYLLCHHLIHMDPITREKLILSKTIPSGHVLEFLCFRSFWFGCEIPIDVQKQLLTYYIDDFTDKNLLYLFTGIFSVSYGSESEPSTLNHIGCPHSVELFQAVSSQRSFSPEFRFIISCTNRRIQVDKNGFTDEMIKLSL